MRILQRCPVYTESIYQDAVRQPEAIEMLIHDDGIHIPDLDEIYKNQIIHDPGNLDEARRLAEPFDSFRLGIFYRNEQRPRYEDLRRLPVHTAEERVELLNEELDRYAV